MKFKHVTLFVIYYVIEIDPRSCALFYNSQQLA